jgi:inner membrane transporter RhtA
MTSIQFGASIAKGLFPLLGAAGTTLFRTSFAAFLLLMIWRPWRTPLSRQSWQNLALYGGALGVMNLCFYLSLQRIPLGVAVALEFTGPLGVALYASRKPLDWVWITLAVLGLGLILPLQDSSSALDPIGVFFALAAGLCWALYIIFGKRAGSAVHGGQAAALGMTMAAVVVFPVGSWQVPWSDLNASVLLQVFMIAILSSALPYSLEMVALKDLPTKTFGILMSLEPALAAMMGFAFLDERLTLQQWLAMSCIMLASAGSAATAPPQEMVPPLAETPLD